jgi:guanosine-3',5'-bis(diphosphate) 3'-pyrophosphohydrolase
MKEIALNIVETAFVGKKDKGGKPYCGHLKRVGTYCKNYFLGCDDDKILLEVIALLHDLLEDCPEWKSQHITSIFKNIVIVDALEKLTKKPETSYEEYIQNIKNDRFARAVKLADLKDNMDITRLPSLNEKDIERIKKYHKSYMFLLDGLFIATQ